MKRFLLCISFLIFLFIFSSCGSSSNNAISEIESDFVIHSGTKFYETADEIKAKETLQLDKEADDSIKYVGTVAEIKNSGITYLFDENGKCNNVLYGFPLSSTSEAENQYKTLTDALSSKYGKPISNDDPVYTLIRGRRYYLIEHNYEVLKSLGSSATPPNYKHIAWVVHCKEYNVKIDLIIEYLDGNTVCRIDYHPYTDEELSSLIQTDKEKNQSIKNDL